MWILLWNAAIRRELLRMRGWMRGCTILLLLLLQGWDRVGLRHSICAWTRRRGRRIVWGKIWTGELWSTLRWRSRWRLLCGSALTLLSRKYSP